MIESIITAIVTSVIPPEYMALVIIILAALVAVEQWLASTKRIQANSTIQLITNIAKRIINKNTPQAPAAPAEHTDDVPDRQ